MIVTEAGTEALLSMSKPEQEIVIHILKVADKKDSIARMTQQEFADDAKVSLSTFTRHFARLSTIGIAITMGHGRLMVNPRLFIVSKAIDVESAKKAFDKGLANRNETIIANRDRKKLTVIKQEEDII